MSKKQLNSISPIFLLVGVALIALVAFFIGTQFNNEKLANNLIAEGSRPGKGSVSPFESDARCENYKRNSTDITPPTVSIIKPTDGENISGIKGTSIVWVTVKATDENGYAYPSLYVNDLFELSPYNFNRSIEDLTILTGYFHVEPNQTYRLKAKACDNGGNEVWSSPITITTSK